MLYEILIAIGNKTSCSEVFYWNIHSEKLCEIYRKPLVTFLGKLSGIFLTILQNPCKIAHRVQGVNLQSSSLVCFRTFHSPHKYHKIILNWMRYTVLETSASWTTQYHWNYLTFLSVGLEMDSQFFLKDF